MGGPAAGPAEAAGTGPFGGWAGLHHGRRGGESNRSPVSSRCAVAATGPTNRASIVEFRDVTPHLPHTPHLPQPHTSPTPPHFPHAHHTCQLPTTLATCPPHLPLASHTCRISRCDPTLAMEFRDVTPHLPCCPPHTCLPPHLPASFALITMIVLGESLNIYA